MAQRVWESPGSTSWWDKGPSQPANPQQLRGPASQARFALPRRRGGYFGSRRRHRTRAGEQDAPRSGQTPRGLPAAAFAHLRRAPAVPTQRASAGARPRPPHSPDPGAHTWGPRARSPVARSRGRAGESTELLPGPGTRVLPACSGPGLARPGPHDLGERKRPAPGLETRTCAARSLSAGCRHPARRLHPPTAGMQQTGPQARRLPGRAAVVQTCPGGKPSLPPLPAVPGTDSRVASMGSDWTWLRKDKGPSPATSSTPRWEAERRAHEAIFLYSPRL
nr:splicing factor 3A subunit 2-like [Manis javanica]